MSNKKHHQYILISPVKDEEKYISTTVESVLNQSILPKKWIIVDDGSKDKTREIIRKYCEELHWIKLICLDRDRERAPGQAVINAFNVGYKEVKNEPYEYIVKLDGDLRLDKQYFEKLFDKFEKNELLGIASGVYNELKGKDFVRVPFPRYHAAGASKVIKRECFEAIGGFVSSRGWDTVDEIKAMVQGWETRNFPDIHFYHLKKEGSGIGSLRTNLMHGEIYYLTGGSKLFFVFKFIHRFVYGDPFFLGSVFMFFGYMVAAIKNRKRLVNDEEMKFYRKMLNKRVLNGMFSINRMRWR